MTISDAERSQLIQAAQECRHFAYAPYSNYLVGAALLADDGQIYAAVNVENASYGLTVCAERNAVAKMVSQGGRQILAIAVCTINGGTPCGACRQVLSEFAGNVPVYLCTPQDHVQTTSLHALLPLHFAPSHLP